MLNIERQVREVSGLSPERVPDEILKSGQPVLLRGLADNWPLVAAARQSAEAAIDYILGFYQDATVGVFLAPPGSGGRVFYNEDMSGFNYRPAKTKLTEVLQGIRQFLEEDDPPAFYMGSTTVDTCLPGFRENNDIELGDAKPLASIWLGNRTRVAAHFDVPDNVAVCAAGHRRFTVFPPDQLKNLYPGPLDFNPGGQSISLVDFEQPDFDRFPLFEKALASAAVADLEPGDALFLPSMWWHHVEGLDAFNVLINYWWRQSPAFMGSPAHVLDHAFLSLRDLPRCQRDAWQELFRHYIFEFDNDSVEHIPENSRGVLSPIDDTMARKLRAQLLNKLNR